MFSLLKILLRSVKVILHLYADRMPDHGAYSLPYAYTMSLIGSINDFLIEIDSAAQEADKEYKDRT